MIVFHASKWGVTVDIEKSDGISLLTFVLNDEVLGLFLHSSIFSIIHSRSASIINDALSDFLYCFVF